MTNERIVLALFVAAASVLGILAGIGTGDSFESTGSFWDEPDSTAVHETE